MPRYVLLRHELPADSERDSHWDFMLEEGDHLLTWAFPELPQPGTQCECAALPAHRLHYLTHEGAISESRGEVARVDAGEYAWIEDRRPRMFIVKLVNARRTMQMTFTHIASDAWQVKIEACV